MDEGITRIRELGYLPLNRRISGISTKLPTTYFIEGTYFNISELLVIAII